MKKMILASIAATAILTTSALAQVPTSPATENSGDESADPTAAGDSTMGTGSATGGTMRMQTETNSVPTSPSQENSGQQSADPASAGNTTESDAGSIGTTTGPAATETQSDVNAVPTSPAAENEGTEGADAVTQ